MRASNIVEMARRLRLPYVRDNLEAFVLEAAAEGYEPDVLLETLFERECELRSTNAVRRNISAAKFPYQMTFEDFKVEHLPPAVQRGVRELKTLEFISEKSNVVLIGNPGVGKTALSIALGTRACAEGKRVLFVNVPNLVVELKEAMSLNALTHYKKNFERYDLVILDDLGYCSFNKECGEVLFNLLSARNGKGSMIFTTNLVFERWNEVFDDPVLTGAIVDRIAYKSYTIDMTGDSYRVMETQRWLKAMG